MRTFSAALALLIAASPAVAQTPVQLPKAPPGTPDTARIVAGNYAIEPYHTQVMFALEHLGFSVFRGFLSGVSGTLSIDPARPTNAKLSVTVPISSIFTTSQKLNEELIGPDWFDVQHFPTATFVSTKITPGPNNIALVDGTLTIHGKTLPVTMQAHFHGAGKSMMSKGTAIGFDGRMALSRSAFGLGKGVPLVSDHVELTIAAAFEQQ